MEPIALSCPLCRSLHTSRFHQSENRVYHHCQACDLVFVPKAYFLSLNDEKAKYDHHQNSPQNSGYVAFLNRLIEPMCDFLSADASGLDFGCGPGPTLHQLMQRKGFKMALYDPFYAPDETVFQRKYDFITVTEVIEHMHDPRFELERLWEMIEPKGVLGIMTAFRVDDFASWYYKRDLTHIRFFTPKTFAWIAAHLHAKLHIPQSGVAILEKR